ncbi:MAG: phage Gp37/Gp68 family protein [candidate division Zixibacteria bacterium]|nr:phage Gp37/Gp68 family protein [candidate division Zixibacteria bacterium]
MSISSSIEWTQSTWNPVTGCSRVSSGCRHCYAERFSKRLQAMGVPSYSNGFEVTLHENLLELPLKWKKPQVIFVNSMSDLFHEKVPLEFIQRIFRTMRTASQHQYQILTKRPERLLECDRLLDWTPNIWMGVTVESKKFTPRIDMLRQTGAFIKFLSLEPLLSALPALNLDRIHWVITGGESGPGARPMDAGWVRDIRDQCLKQSVPFFFKQWGGVFKSKTGRILDGRTWDGMPAALYD